MPTIIPNPKKALFLAKKQLSELVYDAVNLEGVNYTLPEVQTLLDGVTVGGHRQTDELIATNQKLRRGSFYLQQLKRGVLRYQRRLLVNYRQKLHSKRHLLGGSLEQEV